MKYHIVKYICLLTAIVVGLAFSGMFHVNAEAKQADDSRMETILARGSLRCAYVVYPPFITKNTASGKISGFAVDLAESIGAKLNLKIDWVEEVGWATMIEGIRTGRYDAVCTNIWQNANRAKFVSFTEPFGWSTVHAWVKRDRADLASRADIERAGTRIMAQEGTSEERMARTQFTGAKITTLPELASYTDLFMNLTSGKVDTVFVESAVAQQFMANNPGSIRAATAGAPLMTFANVLLLPQGEPALKMALDTALQEIVNGGELSLLMKKHKLGGFFEPARPAYMAQSTR
ncbi:MAG: transporter substrate-binding domain-containing protein [Alphaproteobacteria bacterium]|nr:transporter substrate-binding domain-containing protein [Alphaproteobacteria bacterium]